jgi:ATP-dependent Clp protease ATP-binding subunit ClpC
MSEYQEKHSVSRLIGAPPGYVGYDEGGQLTEQVKNKPYSVVLFDEVEKANKEIFHTLLQMLDEGHLTDSLGRKINFKNTLIIMTSNIGVKKLQDFGTGIGFGGSSYSTEEQKKEILKKEMKNYFSPEFINRIDETIIFNSLDQESLKKIVSIELNKLMKRLGDLKLNFSFDDKLVEHISKVGFDEVYGARPIKRAIQDEVEDLVSESVLSDIVKEGVTYTLSVEDEKVVIK